MATAVFSALLSLLAPAVYMLQVYERVLATGGRITSLFVWLALAIALITFAALDAIRVRFLVPAAARLDARLSANPPAHAVERRAPKRTSDAGSRHRTPDNRHPGTAALFDVRSRRCVILACFLLNFWLGICAGASILVLLAIALGHQQAVRSRVQESTRSLAASHAAEQAGTANAGAIRPLGMLGAMVQW